jgi:hypothetical protein
MNNVKQLGHDRTYAAKMCRARCAAQVPGDFVHFDPAKILLRIHLANRRSKYQIDADFPTSVTVSFKRTGITLEVLIGTELGGVDKDTHYGEIALIKTAVNKNKMPFMQGAHGGYQSDDFAVTTSLSDSLTSLIDCFYDNHIPIRQRILLFIV